MPDIDLFRYRSLTIAFALASLCCGYTILGTNDVRQKAERSRPPARLPDLAVANIEHEYWFRPMEDGPGEEGLAFRVTISNIGNDVFRGSLLIGWADKETDIWARYYPHVGKQVFTGVLEPGDSTEIACTTKAYPPGYRIQFIVHTVAEGGQIDRYWLYPVPEAFTENNTADYYLPVL